MNKANGFLANPALLYGIGLFPLIVACVDFKSALIYAVLLFLTTMFSQLIISAFKLVINKRVRFICYTMVILAVVYFIDSAVCELFLKSYSSIHSLVVYLFASSVIIYAIEMASKAESFGSGFKYVLQVSTSYVITMVLVGFVREFLGKGTVWGKLVFENFVGLEFFSTMAGGLMIVIVFALIFNIIAKILQNRAKIYAQLVERYTAVLNENHKPSISDENKDIDDLQGGENV